MSGILISVAVFLVAIILQGFFAGYETGFVSTNHIRIQHLASEEKDPRASRLLAHIHRPGPMLTTLLIGTNICVVAGTLAVTGELAALDVPARFHELIATVVVTPLFLVFAEIIPKSVFRAHPNRLSLALLPLINIFYAVLQPLAAPITWLTRLLLLVVGGKEENISPLMTTLEDVRVLIDESAHHGTILPEEQKMIHSVFDLQSQQAKEIMKPRIDITAVSDMATRAELLAAFEDSGRTRIPIYHETIDEIRGVAVAHDVLLDDEPENQDIERFIREVMHVPDTMKVDDLFAALKRTKQHIAIVTDEYGGTDGIITIEDILEEIFGEIQDEHDREESPIQQIGPRAYVVDARMPLYEVSEAIGIEIEDEEVDTVGGWVMRMAGRIPAQGEAVRAPGLSMTVLDGGVNYIAKIRLEIQEESPEDGTVSSET